MARPKGPKSEARKAESGGVLGKEMGMFHSPPDMRLGGALLAPPVQSPGDLAI